MLYLLHMWTIFIFIHTTRVYQPSDLILSAKPEVWTLPDQRGLQTTVASRIDRVAIVRISAEPLSMTELFCVGKKIKNLWNSNQWWSYLCRWTLVSVFELFPYRGITKFRRKKRKFFCFAYPDFSKFFFHMFHFHRERTLKKFYGSTSFSCTSATRFLMIFNPMELFRSWKNGKTLWPLQVKLSWHFFILSFYFF